MYKRKYIVRGRQAYLSYVMFTFPFYYYDYRNKKAGKTHTHTHTPNSRYFWHHSCIFSYICTVLKWKVPKPTPTQRVQAEKVSSVDSDLLPVDLSLIHI